MLTQVVYETNADLVASHEAMEKNSLVVADTTEKGLLWFKFKDNRTVFLLSPLGRMQVKWTDVSEKKTLYKLVKNLLVTGSNEKIKITPLKQQAWIEYPVPKTFKLFWCDQETEFVLKKAPEAKQKPLSFGAQIANVKKAVEELRHEFRFFREPTVNEVALKSGSLNSNALDIGLRFKNCYRQSMLGAQWEAERAINLAGWLSFKDKVEPNPQLKALANQAVDASEMEDISRAQDILKNYPDLVPKVNSTELKWPDETKIKWIEAFGCPPPAPQHWTLWPTSLQEMKEQ